MNTKDLVYLWNVMKAVVIITSDIHVTIKDKKGKRRFVVMHNQTLNSMCGLSEEI